MGIFSWRDSGGVQRTMTLTFTLLVGADDQGSPVEQCLDDVARVVDSYLAGSGRCCSMQGGYCMDVDGATLVDTGGIDELSNPSRDPTDAGAPYPPIGIFSVPR